MTEQTANTDEKPRAETAEASRDGLFRAVLTLGSEADARAFLTDLLTPSELRALAERWLVARLLDEGALSYREIAERAQTSTTTVVRVARFLKEEPHQGYRLVLDRMKDTP